LGPERAAGCRRALVESGQAQVHACHGEMTPQQQLNRFVRRYSPAVARLGRAALAKMRKRFRFGFELVYDNYNALAVGYAPTDRASTALCSIALYPRWVRLFFLKGAALPDPEGVLTGTGGQVRSVVLEGVRTL